MTDAIQMENMKSNVVPHEKYRESEWRYLDSINADYSTGEIRFDTQNLVDNWIVWSNAYVEIPLTFTAASNATLSYVQPADPVAMRNGVTSALFGCNVQTNSVSVSRNTEISEVENIRHMFKSTRPWEKTAGVEEMYSMDKRNDADPYGAAAPDLSAAIVANTAWENTVGNVGFDERVRSFKNASVFVPGADGGAFATYKTVIRVPLRKINEVFASLDYPVSNIRLQLEVIMATLNRTTQPVLITVPSTPTNDAERALASQWIMTVGGGDLKPRLYFESVKFSAGQWSDVSRHIGSSKLKTHEYIDYRVFRKDVSSIAATQVSELITTGLRNVKSVYVMGRFKSFYGTGRVKSRLNPLDSGNNFKCAFTNMNLSIDSKHYYPTSITDQYHAWQIVKEEQLDDGRYGDPSLLTFVDFCTNNRVYAMNIERNPNLSVDSSKPVSLLFSGTVAGSSVNAVDRRASASYGKTYPEAGGIELTFIVFYGADLSINLADGTVSSSNQ